MLTGPERRAVEMCLTGYVGPVDDAFWSYLDLGVNRTLSEEERADILQTYLGHRKRPPSFPVIDRHR